MFKKDYLVGIINLNRNKIVVFWWYFVLWKLGFYCYVNLKVEDYCFFNVVIK